MEWPEEGARVYNVAVGGVKTTTTFHIPTLLLAPKGAQEEKMMCVSPSVQCGPLCYKTRLRGQPICPMQPVML